MANFGKQQVQWDGLVQLLSFCLLGLAWLLPNKNYPWLSAWNEGLAFVSVGIISLVVLGHSLKNQIGAQISRPMLLFIVLSIVSVWTQWLTEILVFRGDAWLVTLYLGFFALSMQAAFCMNEISACNDWLDGLMGSIAIAGLVTVALSLIQWTATYDLTVFVQETGFRGRPFANLGQINHVNTLFFMAACAVLHLHSTGRVRSFVMLMAVVILAFGMALTQSRTALVQIFFLWIWSTWQKKSFNPLNNSAAALVLAYLLWMVLVPYIAAFAGLGPGRPLYMEASDANLRLKAWAAMWDAIIQHPLAGYGWLQNAMAQQMVAHENLGLRYEFNYSHNFVVDIIVWVGVPLGFIMVGCLAYWFWCHAKSRNDRITFVAAALLGVMVHGLLEYPLAYAYFLLPTGFLMGSIDALDPVVKMQRIHKFSMALLVMGLSALLIGVGNDYAKAVETDTLLRTEASRIGVAGKTTPPPGFYFLDQLEAQFGFRFIDPRPNMSEDQLALMERVARRYATLPVLTDFAYARQLNGDKLGSDYYLNLSCAIYGDRVCERDMELWSRKRVISAGRLDVYVVPSAMRNNHSLLRSSHD